jgi:polyisoprenoid-binding protein YceI
METAKAILVHYVLDTKASRFTAQAFATGLLSAMGHNPTIGIRNFTGQVDFSADELKASGFRLTIQAASLSVQDDISDKDRREIERLMNEQVLEVGQYPQIVYDAPEISITKLEGSLYTATMNGSLSLHGVTRGQPVTARIAVFGEMLRASGDFTVKQSEYQIRPFAFAGGTLKLQDEVKLFFEMVARQQG